jgi:hypothetical protein
MTIDKWGVCPLRFWNKEDSYIIFISTLNAVGDQLILSYDRQFLLMFPRNEHEIIADAKNTKLLLCVCFSP